MTEPKIVEFHWEYLQSAAELYAFHYDVKMAGNTEYADPIELSREVIVNHALRESFIGVLAIDADAKVQGFAWGYASPTGKSRLTQLVHKRLGEQWTDDTFVMEAFGIHPNWYQSEMSEALITALSALVEDDEYKRLRTRIERARLDNLPQALDSQGWEELNGLGHVVWLGKEIT